MQSQKPEKYSSKTLTTQALLFCVIVLLICLVGVEVIRQSRQPKTFAENRVKQRRALPLRETGRERQSIESDSLVKRYSTTIQTVESELADAHKKINLMDLTIDTLAKRLEFQREDREKAEEHYQEELRNLRIAAFDEQERLTKSLHEHEKEKDALTLALEQKTQAISHYEREVSQHESLLDLQVIEIKDLITQLENQKNALGLETVELRQKLESEQARVIELDTLLQELTARYDTARELMDGSLDLKQNLERAETKLACKDMELGALFGTFDDTKSDLSTQIQDLSFILNWEKANSENLQTKLQKLMTQYEEEQTRAEQLQAKLNDITEYAKETETHLAAQETLTSTKQTELQNLLERYQVSQSQVESLAEEGDKAKELAQILNGIVSKTLTLEKELLEEKQRFAAKEKEFEEREKELNLTLKAEKMRSEEVADALQAAFVELSSEKERASEIEQSLYLKQNTLAALEVELEEQKTLLENRQQEFTGIQEELLSRLKNEQLGVEDLTDKLFIAYSQNEVDKQTIADLELQVAQVQTNHDKMRENFLSEQKRAQETSNELLASIQNERINADDVAHKLEEANLLCGESEKRIYELEQQVMSMQTAIEGLRDDLIAKESALTEREADLEKAALELSTIVAEENSRVEGMTEEINGLYRKFTDEQALSKGLEEKLNLAFDRAADFEELLRGARRELVEKEQAMSLLTHQLNNSLSEEYTRAQQSAIDLQKTMENLALEQNKGLELAEQLSVLEVELDVQKGLIASKEQELSQEVQKTRELEGIAKGYEEEKLRVAGLQQELARALEDRADLDREVENQKTRISTQEIEVAKQMEELSTLLQLQQGQNQEIAAELKQTTENYFAEKQKIHALDQELFQAKASIEDLTSALQEQRDQLTLNDEELSDKIDGEKERVQKLAKVLKKTLRKHDIATTKKRETETLLHSKEKEWQQREQGLGQELSLALARAGELEHELQLQQNAFEEKSQEIHSYSEHIKTAYELEKERSLELTDALQKAMRENNEEQFRFVKLETELTDTLEKAKHFEEELADVEALLVEREREFDSQSLALTSALKSEQERVQSLTASLQKTAIDFEEEKLKAQQLEQQLQLAVEKYERAEQLESELQMALEKNTCLEKELSLSADLVASIDELEMKERALKEALARDDVERERLESILERENLRTQELESELVSAEEQMVRLREEIAHQRGEIYNQETLLQATVDNERQQVQELLQAYQQEKLQVQELEEQLSIAEVQTDFLKGEIEEQRLSFAEKETNLKADLAKEQMLAGELSQELASLKERGEYEKNQTQGMEEELLSALSRADQLETQLIAEKRTFSEREANLFASLEEERGNAQSLNEAYTSLNASHEETVQELKSALDQVARLDETLAEQRSLVAYKSSEMQLLQNQVETIKLNFDSSEEQQNLNSEKIAYLQSELAEKTALIQHKEEALEQEQALISQLQSQFQALQSNDEQNRERIALLQSELEEKTALAQHRETTIEEDQALISQLQSQFQALQSNDEQNRERIALLQSELEEKTALAQQKENALGQDQAVISQLQSQLQTAIEYQSAYEVCQEQNNQMQDRIASLQKELEVKTTLVHQKESVLEQDQALIGQLQNQLQTAHSGQEATREKIALLEKELEAKITLSQREDQALMEELHGQIQRATELQTAYQVSQEQNNQLQETIASLQSQLQAEAEQQSTYQMSQEQHLEKIANLQSQLQTATELQTAYQVSQEQNNQLQETIASLQNALDAKLQNENTFGEEQALISELQSELEAKTTLIKQKEKALNEGNARIVVLRNELQNAQEQQSVYQVSKEHMDELEGKVQEMKQTIGTLKNELNIERLLVQNKEEQLQALEDDKGQTVNASEKRIMEMGLQLSKITSKAEEFKHQLSQKRKTEESLQQTIEEYATTQELLKEQIQDLKTSLGREKMVTQEVTEELQKTLSNFNTEQRNNKRLEKKLEEVSSLMQNQKDEQTTAALEE